MRIGIDIRCLMDKNYSGVAFYTYNLLKSLFSIDTKNEYVLFYNSSKHIELPRFSQGNVKYIGFHYPNKLFNLSLGLLHRPDLDKLAGQVDVWFTPNPNFVSWSGRCRKVITVHDLSFLRFPEFFSWKMRLWHRAIGLGRTLNTADQIIAVSENTKKDIVAFYNIRPDKEMGYGACENSGSSR